MSTVPRLYCDKFGGYDFPRNFHLIKPLKNVKKKMKSCVYREFVIKEN